MNGSTFSQVLILIDGLRINDPQTGHHNLNIPIRPQDLDRIENKSWCRIWRIWPRCIWRSDQSGHTPRCAEKYQYFESFMGQ